jgi:hypothetical protein
MKFIRAEPVDTFRTDMNDPAEIIISFQILMHCCSTLLETFNENESLQRQGVDMMIRRAMGKPGFQVK